jgi:hypothetical protein
MSDGADLAIPELSAEEWRRWWESLRWLRRHPGLGAAAVETFGVLWLRCEGRVTEGHRVYLPDLVRWSGVKEDAIRGRLDRLQAADIVLVRRDGKGRIVARGGWLVIDVYHPNPAERSGRCRKKGPQMEFGFMDADPSEEGKGKRSYVSGYVCRGKRSDVCLPTDREKIIEQCEASQLSMAETFRLVCGEQRPTQRGPPARDLRDIRYRHQISKSDISKPCASDEQIVRQAEYERLIFERMGDPQLRPVPVSKVAAALAAGQIEWKTVSKVIHRSLEIAAEQKKPKFVYFVKAMKDHFGERQLAW